MTWNAWHPAVLPPEVSRLLRDVRIYSVSPLTVVEGQGDPVRAVNGLPHWQHATGDRVTAARMGGNADGSGLGSDLLIVASRATRPTRGTVTASTADTVTVTMGGASWVLSRAAAYAPTVGDTVKVLWDADGGTVLGKVAAATPAPGEVVIGPGTGSSTIQLELDPIAAGTYRSGSLRTDGDTPGRLYQGHWTNGSAVDNSGLWIHGDVWGSTAGKSCSDLRVKVKRYAGIGTNAARPVHLRLHKHTALPTGAPEFVGAEWAGLSLPTGGSDWAILDAATAAAWGALLSSGGAYSVGVTYAGTTDYAAFYGPGPGSDGSGHISSTWQ